MLSTDSFLTILPTRDNSHQETQLCMTMTALSIEQQPYFLAPALYC